MTDATPGPSNDAVKAAARKRLAKRLIPVALILILLNVLLFTACSGPTHPCYECVTASAPLR